MGSTRRPNCNPPCGGAQGDLLIPVIGSDVGVDGVGVEQKKEMGQAHQGVVDETEDTGACGVCEVTGEWRSASSKTTTWTEISHSTTPSQPHKHELITC